MENKPLVIDRKSPTSFHQALLTRLLDMTEPRFCKLVLFKPDNTPEKDPSVFLLLNDVRTSFKDNSIQAIAFFGYLDDVVELPAYRKFSAIGLPQTIPLGRIGGFMWLDDSEERYFLKNMGSTEAIN